MKKLIVGALIGGLCIVSAWAQDAILRDDTPERYTVQRGDTLWGISSKFLQNPWMWPEIWYVNPQIDNPHLIYPGDTIALVYVDGQPQLILERGNRQAARPSRPAPPAGTVKLSPSIRVVPLEDAIPSIPLDDINSFLSKSRIVTVQQMEEAPYVVAGGRNRLIVGKGDFLYARGQFPDDISAYGVYRKGDVYRDPETNEVLGVQARDIGSVRVTEFERDLATSRVTRTTEEIRIADRLLVQEQRAIDSTFWPSAPSVDIEGRILAVEGGISQVGKLDVVILNRGEREGLQVGNILAVYKAGEITIDQLTNERIRLPDEKAGLLMVFRTYDKLSYGLVLEAELPLATLDSVRNP